MKTNYFLGFLLIITIGRLHGQQVVSTLGGFQQTTTGSISSTMGETSTETYSNASGSITQGFQQCFIQIIPGASIETLNYDLVVYPNPTSDAITIKTNNGLIDELSVSIYDSDGRAMDLIFLNSPVSRIDLTNFRAGTYILQLKDRNQRTLRTFTIIKN